MNVLVLRECTLTYDPKTTEVRVVMLVDQDGQRRRYEFVGCAHDAGPAFTIDEMTVRMPFLLPGRYDRIPVGPSRHRLGVEVTVDTISSEVRAVPAAPDERPDWYPTMRLRYDSHQWSDGSWTVRLTDVATGRSTEATGLDRAVAYDEAFRKLDGRKTELADGERQLLAEQTAEQLREQLRAAGMEPVA